DKQIKKMAGDDHLYLDNIDEYVNDQNKIVTYKWLSRTLSVHVNTAKQMLHHYVTKQRNEGNAVDVAYFISGLEDGGSHKVIKCVVVPEGKLESTKRRLATIFTVHPYSVQRCKLLDYGMLYAADYDRQQEHITDSNLHSSIVHPSVKQDSSNVESLADISTPESKTDSSSKNTSKETKSNSSMANGKSDAKKTPGNANATDSKPPTKRDKVKGIASLFANQNVKSNRAKDGESKDIKKEMPTADVEDRRPVQTVDDKPAATDDKSSKNRIKKRGAKQKLSLKKKKKVDVESDDEDIKPAKKRKRILRVESSSSDDDDLEANDRLDQENMEPEASENDDRETKERPEDDVKKKKTEYGSVKVTQNKRNRRRRQVDKTYVDDEGFMVTRKEWVSESGESDDGEAKS
ncbi:POLD3 (predicted), partial [Pycnogonum litorale]